MANARSESRKKTGLIGIRVDPDLEAWLTNEAAARGVSKAEMARTVLDAARHGSRRHRPRRSFEISAADRMSIGTFNRHAGRLTGALVMTAKSARIGHLVSYQTAVEHLLIETKALRQAVDRLIERISS